MARDFEYSSSHADPGARAARADDLPIIGGFIQLILPYKRNTLRTCCTCRGLTEENTKIVLKQGAIAYMYVKLKLNRGPRGVAKTKQGATGND